MNTPSPTPSPTRRSSTSRTSTLGFLAFALGLTLMVGAYLTFYFGLVSGEEFSPDDFSRRTFTYYRLPVVNWQVTPIKRTTITDSLGSYLLSQKLVKKPAAGNSQRWDLVVAESGIDRQVLISQGEARILCAYLDAKRDGKQVWLDWSHKHPPLAKILWPTIVKLAHEELYVFIPDVLLAARGAEDAALLKQEINSILAREYQDFATTQQQLGRHEPAIELFTGAIAHAPDNMAAYSGRAASWKAVGQSEKAAADLARAGELEKEPE